MLSDTKHLKGAKEEHFRARRWVRYLPTNPDNPTESGRKLLPMNDIELALFFQGWLSVSIKLARKNFWKSRHFGLLIGRCEWND